jgi:Cu/Ag efflux protein CusF
MKKRASSFRFGCAFCAALLVLSVHAASQSDADNPNTERRFSGTIQSIDRSTQTITIKNNELSRTFTLGANASVSLRDNPNARLSDLKNGDEVSVQYSERDGRLAAVRVSQPETDTAGTESSEGRSMGASETHREIAPRSYSGTIATIDPQTRIVTIKQMLISHNFYVPNDVKLESKGKSLDLSELKVGDEVNIRYVERDGQNQLTSLWLEPRAEVNRQETRTDQGRFQAASGNREDDQSRGNANVTGSRTEATGGTTEMKNYSGVVTAVDPAAGSIAVRKALISHTFKVSGDAAANLSNIRVGDEVNVDYHESDGNKIAQSVSPVSRGAAQPRQSGY